MNKGKGYVFTLNTKHETHRQNMNCIGMLPLEVLHWCSAGAPLVPPRLLVPPVSWYLPAS